MFYLFISDHIDCNKTRILCNLYLEHFVNAKYIWVHKTYPITYIVEFMNSLSIRQVYVGTSSLAMFKGYLIRVLC